MISLKEIERQYPESLQSHKRFMLREYLQYKILEILFNSEFFGKLCFMGGTCLRIVHANTRFSEDLDFDNFNLESNEFDSIAATIARRLQSQGYRIEIETVTSGTFHCHIKFPGLLFEEGLSGYQEEKILITIDTEPQHFDYIPDKTILNKFDVFTAIQATPPDILLSQKFFAMMNRERKKGRDFFDILFLLKNTRPNYLYLERKIGIVDDKQLKNKIIQDCKDVDLSELSKDVAPFLFEAEDARKIELFLKYIEQVL